MVAASVAGRSHLARGASCEDYHAVRVVDGANRDVAILGLADGAGSAAAALHGAKTGVDAAVASISREVEGDGVAALEIRSLREAVVCARNAVFQAADDFGHLPDEYASTFLLVVVTAERTFAAHIGDGAIVVDDDELRVLSFPDQGEYANATHFLTDADALEVTRFAEHAAVRRVALLTDGLQALALEYATRSAYVPFFGPVFDRIAEPSIGPSELNAELASWLESDAVNARTNDDKSLVVAVRMP